MGFMKRWDVNVIEQQIRSCASAASSWHNDGWVASEAKHDLYKIKCLLEDIYCELPKFTNESEWEGERIMEILKR